VLIIKEIGAIAYILILSIVPNLANDNLNDLFSRHIFLKSEHLVAWHLYLQEFLDFILGHLDLPRNICILVKVTLVCYPLSLMASSSNSCLECARVLPQTMLYHTPFSGKDSQVSGWVCDEVETFNKCHSSR
jgi:hypothetical protein